ncbi:hypothetical protein [Frigidibacter sp. SD6-1]|uniref:hypothetical protein n=1 Tax=Frigidibacter sp. SD6-1 TaxID=3032581 RepID=UPI0024E01A08|nr:hypothetical protein [Frigidibacter sp. SD6-1]
MATCLVLIGAGIAGQAEAEPLSPARCTILSAELAFGTVDPVTNSARRGVGRVELDCRNPSDAPVQVIAVLKISQGKNCNTVIGDDRTSLVFGQNGRFEQEKDRSELRYPLELAANTRRKITLPVEGFFRASSKSPAGLIDMECEIALTLEEPA